MVSVWGECLCVSQIGMMDFKNQITLSQDFDPKRDEGGKFSLCQEHERVSYDQKVTAGCSCCEFI